MTKNKLFTRHNVTDRVPAHAQFPRTLAAAKYLIANKIVKKP